MNKLIVRSFLIMALFSTATQTVLPQPEIYAIDQNNLPEYITVNKQRPVSVQFKAIALALAPTLTAACIGLGALASAIFYPQTRPIALAVPFITTPPLLTVQVPWFLLLSMGFASPTSFYNAHEGQTEVISKAEYIKRYRS